MKKIILGVLLAAMMTIFTVSCDTAATIASRNLSQAADQFEIYRRVVFYNGITNEYILVVEGYCSITADTMDKQLELTVKTRSGYLKHFLGLSDNVTYFVEQLQSVPASEDQYRVIFRPKTIVPTIELDM